MTLCVAAACQDHGKGRLVIGNDWKVSIQSATAEIQEKLFWITEDIPVMIAGTISRAIELKDTYSAYFEHLKARKQNEITQNQVTDVLKKPLAIYKQKLANEHTSMKLGLSFKDFRSAVGRNEIPLGIATETFTEISRISLQCSLILCLFIKKEPYIYRIDEDGTVNNCDNFAAIGSGSPIAEGSLYQREHRSNMTLARTIYHVFEAMKLGSIASDVGEEHTIDVLYPAGEKGKTVKGETLTNKAEDFLKKQFGRLGPKKFTKFVMPKNFLKNDF